MLLQLPLSRPSSLAVVGSLGARAHFMLPTQWRPFVVVLVVVVAAAAAAAVAHQVGKAKLRMGETLSWDAIVLRRATIAPKPVTIRPKPRLCVTSRPIRLGGVSSSPSFFSQRHWAR